VGCELKDGLPQVTIVVPCFNQVRFLAECLESVVEQTLPDWEAIVVDDASTEAGIDDVIEQIGDPRVRLVRHDVNRGLGAARNTGFRAARADLVLPLDCDDRLHAEFLSATVAALAETEEADCVFADFRLFGAIDGVWEWDGEHALPAMTVTQTIPGPGVLTRRALWDRVGGYSEAIELRGGNEDWDFWLAAMPGLRPIRIPRPLYLYRRHAASMTAHSLLWDDCVQRDFIYDRHRPVFDRCGTGGRFRAAGYLNSAVCSWSTGDRRRAARIAARAIRSRELRGSFARLAASRSLRFLVRSARRGARIVIDPGRDRRASRRAREA
jgi:glycosyltransferase involved in cell wall biosynthesis